MDMCIVQTIFGSEEQGNCDGDNDSLLAGTSRLASSGYCPLIPSLQLELDTCTQ